MRKLIKILIIGILFANLLVMAMTFFTAYHNEGKEVTIYINKYHEAWYEAILLPIFICLGIYLLYNEFKGVYNKFREKL